ncbi:MAG: hypothetical protein WC045_02300 [Patescibacteria group bacterium]
MKTTTCSTPTTISLGQYPSAEGYKKALIDFRDGTQFDRPLTLCPTAKGLDFEVSQNKIALPIVQVRLGDLSEGPIAAYQIFERAEEKGLQELPIEAAYALRMAIPLQGYDEPITVGTWVSSPEISGDNYLLRLERRGDGNRWLHAIPLHYIHKGGFEDWMAEKNPEPYPFWDPDSVFLFTKK